MGIVSTLDAKQFIWLLMLAPFLAVVGSLIYWFRSRRRVKSSSGPDQIVVGATTSPPRRTFRTPFDQPSRWLAVRTHDIDNVRHALGLIHAHPCSWEQGITEARDHKLFISPPISGWILVVGAGLPEPSEDVDKTYLFLMELSRKLGHVQFFSFNRVLNHHSWAIVERGCVYRGYAWAGRTLWNQGLLTAAEKDVAMACFDYTVDPTEYAHDEAWAMNAEKVSRLAGWWSIDPFCIGERTWLARPGIVGNVSHFREH